MSAVPQATAAVSPGAPSSTGPSPMPPPAAERAAPERLEVVVVGGSQSGLAMGYELARRGLPFVILDAGARIGDAWRARYDSLTLFTPAQYNCLPGLPFPRPAGTYPTKDDVADYLALYARTFHLPVRLNSRVTALEQDPSGTGHIVRTKGGTYLAAQVVVATGGYQRPHVPSLSRDLDPEVFQLHSSHYRTPGQLPRGDVLVVGAGNSGAQIAAELSRDRQVYLSAGKRPPSLPQRFLGKDLFWWLHTLGYMEVTVDSRLGRTLRGREVLIGTDLRKLARENGLRLVGRTERAQGDRVATDDGRTLKVRNMIWATGYRPDYAWIGVPVVDAQGGPMHRRGVTAVPGLYFLGLHWQYRRGSALLGGVGRDAAYLAANIADRACSKTQGGRVRGPATIQDCPMQGVEPHEVSRGLRPRPRRQATRVLFCA